ncbi:MAG TPA: zf-HC2 domain-containing protein [Bryobacteraceae bacterium]|jgi:predicted anti-sigma-YlaC factor YlaD
MSERDHLTKQLSIRAIDGELSDSEALVVAGHLAQCEKCRQAQEEWRQVSLGVERLVAAVALDHFTDGRAKLAEKLEARAEVKATRQTPEKVMWRFGWGMAIAATLALGIIVAPRPKHTAAETQSSSITVPSNALEVDGESFVALPYSNPDLPVSASRIVQMQVPVSSLADVGIALEPVSSRVLGEDRSVLADVLIGADGQPLGVHVLGLE